MITVSDTGPGVPEEELPYVFDRFYTSSETANSQGTGLGCSSQTKLPSGTVPTFVWKTRQNPAAESPWYSGNTVRETAKRNKKNRPE